MQNHSSDYVSIPPAHVNDVSVDNGRPRLSVERTIIDLVDELGRPEDLDAVIHTALRHRLTTPSRLGLRAVELARRGHASAEAVLDSLARLAGTQAEADTYASSEWDATADSTGHA